jgi:hypothetical protein
MPIESYSAAAEKVVVAAAATFGETNMVAPRAAVPPRNVRRESASVLPLGARSVLLRPSGAGMEEINDFKVNSRSLIVVVALSRSRTSDEKHPGSTLL